jgi:heme-degrading monooxygenase HmoA
MPVMSVTRLRVRSWRFLPVFLIAAMRSGRQASRADGNLAVSVFRDRRNAFWTLTSWDSEASMKAFILAAPHGPAMLKLLEWCDEAALAHWTQNDPELPSWTEAHKRLLRYGRPSKVNHPSDAQKVFHIDEPDESARTQKRLK